MNQKTKTQETDFYKHYLKVKELILNTGSIPRDLRGPIRTTLKNLNCYSYENGIYTINEINEIDFNIKLSEYKNKKPIYVFDNENKLVYASYCGALVAKKFNKQLIQVRRMVKNLPTFKKDYYFSYDRNFKIPDFEQSIKEYKKVIKAKMIQSHYQQYLNVCKFIKENPYKSIKENCKSIYISQKNVCIFNHIGIYKAKREGKKYKTILLKDNLTEIEFNEILNEHKNKKPIYIFDYKNLLIDKLSTQREAVEKYNLSATTVNRMLKGAKISGYNYYCSFDKNYVIPEHSKKTYRKSSKQTYLIDEMIEDLKSGGKLSVLTRAQICKEMDIHEKTFNNWLTRSEELKQAYLNRDFKVKGMQYANAKYKNLNENAFNKLRKGEFNNLTTQQIADKFDINIKLFYSAMDHNQELKELVNNRGFKQPKASRGLIHLTKEEKDRVMTERKLKRIVKAREEKRNTPKQMSVKELIQKQREREKQGLKIVRKTKMSAADLKNKVKNYR